MKEIEKLISEVYRMQSESGWQCGSVDVAIKNVESMLRRVKSYNGKIDADGDLILVTGENVCLAGILRSPFQVGRNVKVFVIEESDNGK